jgi:hypothetical protein
MTLVVQDSHEESTGFDPIDVQLGRSDATAAPRSRSSLAALDWSTGPFATVALLLLGAALGPHGLAVLTPRILAFLDSAAPVAIAALGVIAGLNLRIGPADQPVTAASNVQALVAALVVATGVLIAGPPLTAVNLFSPWWMGALVLAIAAATSSSLSTERAENARDVPMRVEDHDYILPIVIGGVLLASLREASLVAALLLVVQAIVVAIVVAGAGWLLLSRASTPTEERVFAFACLLLLGGAADYLSVSALLGGLVAGAFWLRTGGAVREYIRRDVAYVQHTLLVLIFLLAGARAVFSPAALMLSIAYVLFRTVGKLIGGAVARRQWPALPDDAGVRLISPGVFGVAFALNVVRAAGPESAPILTVAVVGTIVSSVVAAAARSRTSEP